ncbi:ABC transporter permease [Vibrio aestuarianus]|uniref:ABC transporter permease n=1 Tax=Vibrio aestuarianus TaxID=28171 RepID=UPI00237CFEF6|nr:ABC transporter permease [Vibrio aestuarianus]MDE1330745.1 ABC transporter permease [Vibrio aestuarianus]
MKNYIFNLVQDLKNHKDIWWFLSKQDLNSQFRRSKLGSLWLVINQLSFAFGAGLIWATVFGLDPIEFIPFIATGFAVWAYVAACFVEGCAAFNISQGYIKQVNMPLPIYTMRIVTANIIRLLIGLIVAFLVVTIFGSFDLSGFIFIIPGLVLVTTCGFFISLTLSYVGAKYKDLQHGLSNLFQLLFVLTPVIYPPEMLIKKGLWFAVYFNPLSAFIQVIRVPLVEGKLAHSVDYLVLVVTLITFIFLSYFAENRLKHKVAYSV